MEPTPAIQPFEFDRALAAFDPRRVPAYRFDLLVVGGGVAGGAAALAAARSGRKVGLLLKGGLLDSNTYWAQGGMAAALGVEDSVAAHVRDTLTVGCGLCEEDVVERVVRGGRAAVDQLLQWGASFDRTPEGELSLSREGGHAHARVLHAQGDATGMEIQRAIARAIEAEPAITCFPHTFAIDLLRDSAGAARGLIASRQHGEALAFLAGQVVLATGGAGQIYRETTNPVIATGDGVALGFRAGAVVRDLEFFQFHPTCLYIAGAARVLISEIVRGAGGVLRDRNGVRFMPLVHADAELGPRDVVSRAVFERMVATDDTSVYLDLSGIAGDPHALFPGISRICRSFGIDIARDPVPVRPGAHYMVGGLKVDRDGRTSVPGLWAVGECASSGLHGANRMGSNSLLEGLVLGTHAGALAAARPIEQVELAASAPSAERRSRADADLRFNLEDVTYSLKSLMWRQMGVKRSARALEDALAKIRLWTRAVRELAPAEPRNFELTNMLTVAALATTGALAREESRGVHHREDHPEPRAEWLCHTELEPVFEGSLLRGARVRRAPVAEMAAA